VRLPKLSGCIQRGSSANGLVHFFRALVLPKFMRVKTPQFFLRRAGKLVLIAAKQARFFTATGLVCVQSKTG
jgi:hypothetical protein